MPDGVTFYIAEPCHFFVTGGQSGSYEDINGNWIPVQGATQIVREGANRDRLSLSAAQRRTAALYDLKGARQGFLDKSGSRHSPASQLRRGAYVVVAQGVSRRLLELN